jgi:hypothetical protein
VDVNGGVEGAAPNENAELLVAGAGVVGALAGVDLPNSAVVLLPHVTMIDCCLCLLNVMESVNNLSGGNFHHVCGRFVLSGVWRGIQNWGLSPFSL